MLLVRCFFVFTAVIAVPSINLYHTDENEQQHHCLYVDLSEGEWSREFIPYCLSESPSQWQIEQTGYHSFFTFAELNRRNVTSEQLLQWSASMDTSERYQRYLNEHHGSDMGLEIFYNCTSPAFGPRCQYRLNVSAGDLSVNELIHAHYQQETSSSSESLTCYTHLQCDRGLGSVCLDWREICDGKIDCADGSDEKDCWLLMDNHCRDGEFRCDNGQCVHSRFVNNGVGFGCLDRSDQYTSFSSQWTYNEYDPPAFRNEDVLCSWRKRNVHDYTHRLTSSCQPQRYARIEQEMFVSDSSSMVSTTCFLALKCHSKIPIEDKAACAHVCQNETCIEMIRNRCPQFIFYPSIPVAFGHIYFAYSNEYATNFTGSSPILPEYVCYNQQLCGPSHSNRTLLLPNNRTCRPLKDFRMSGLVTTGDPYLRSVQLVYSQLGHCNPLLRESSVCSNRNMYRCKNSSQCIPYSYLDDGIQDCDYADDEEQATINQHCLTDRTDTFFRCQTTNKCIRRDRVEDGDCDCEVDDDELCDDENQQSNRDKREIRFSQICDGSIDLVPILINGQSKTDETDCEHWPCNNTYTRCDGFWTCPDGADEVDCHPSSLLQCPPYHHICISPMTSQLMCLPIHRGNDGVVDCIGGTDEPRSCPRKNRYTEPRKFYCRSDDSDLCLSWGYVCDGFQDCENGEDENFCNTTLIHISPRKSYDHVHVPSPSDSNERSTKLSMNNTPEHHCHRGVPLKVLLDINKNVTAITCLCPPSYYGDRCQYQNQRVSLSVQINASLTSRLTPFVLIVSLIDDSAQRTVHSYEQLSYLPVFDEYATYNLYLLYSTRPKSHVKRYAVHIDIYESRTLHHRGSVLLPMQFPFLPVERIAAHIDIPPANDVVQTCTDLRCVHGRCSRYLQESHMTSFCRCHPGWTGRSCDVPHECTCSPDSLCAGVDANNRSICICPMNKFGAQCFLTKSACRHNPCLNKGVCIPTDERIAYSKSYHCLCVKGFHGQRCEVPDHKIILSLAQHLQLPPRSSMSFHFIHRAHRLHSKNPTKVCDNETTITTYWSYPFNIAIAELAPLQYYLVANENVDAPSVLVRHINSSARCRPIDEIFPANITRMHLITRVKYYQLPCLSHSPDLSCFYDERYMCTCQNFGDTPLTNCFEFNHQIKLAETTLAYNQFEPECWTDYSSNSSNITTRPPIPGSGVSSVHACDMKLILLFCFFIYYKQ